MEESSITPQIIFYFVSGAVSLTALVLSCFSVKRSNSEEKSKLYLDLRSRYLEVRRLVPDHYFEIDSDIGEASKDWMFVEQYWYNAFDEWMSTTQLNNGRHTDLWGMYFKPAIQSTLKYRAMRKVIWKMTNGSVSFGVYRKQYRDVLDELWKEIGVGNSMISDGFK